jgi:hypothetical protein
MGLNSALVDASRLPRTSQSDQRPPLPTSSAKSGHRHTRAKHSRRSRAKQRSTPSKQADGLGGPLGTLGGPFVFGRHSSSLGPPVHPLGRGGRPGAWRMGSKSSPSLPKVFTTNALFASSGFMPGCSRMPPVRSINISPSRSIASRSASARSSDWQASVRSSRPATSDTSYSFSTRFHRAKPGAPRARGGALLPLPAGLTTFRSGFLRILWPTMFRVISAQANGSALSLSGDCLCSHPPPLREQCPICLEQSAIVRIKSGRCCDTLLVRKQPT